MSSACVLIVDDEVGRVEILRFYLKDLALEVAVADGVGSALQRLQRERFHAVLCDLVTPGGGGQAVLRAVV